MYESNRPRRRAALPVYLTAAFALLLTALAHTPAAHAQQWTTTNNDINNANSGNVGIGTTAPSAKLEVTANTAGNVVKFTNSQSWTGTQYALNVSGYTNLNGFRVNGADGQNSLYLSGGQLGFTSDTGYPITFSQWTGAGGLERMRIDAATGNVGVGTTSPGYKFDVQGGQLNASGGLCIAGECKTAWSQVGGGSSQWTMSGNDIHNANSGNVGIGTATPYHRLEVSGPGVAVGFNPGNTSAFGWNAVLNRIVARSNFGALDGTSAAEIRFLTGTNSWAKGQIAFFTNDYDSTQGGYTFERMRITNAGNVGIGTSAPGYRLDVQGGQLNASGGLCIAGDCKTSWAEVGGGGSQWTTSGSNIHYSTGSVGVGTSTPNGRFEVAGGPIFFGDMGNTGWGNMLLRGRVFSSNSNIHLSPPGGTGVYIDSNFREAGGASGPVNLHVSGDVNAGGTITGGNIVAKYQDVAEWVPSTQKLAAGTVVVLDSERSNHVLASTAAYDTRVAGVVSAQPGLILGEAGEGKLMVATTGRVRMQVDATRAPIRIGDLLVTSDVAGVAMKSEPVVFGGRQMHAPGTIIGKALEPLAAGTGEILVLLSMQ